MYIIYIYIYVYYIYMCVCLYRPRNKCWTSGNVQHENKDINRCEVFLLLTVVHGMFLLFSFLYHFSFERSVFRLTT